MTRARKSPIYGNLTITSPEGQPMFRCDERKFSWYIRKGLAVQVDDLTARLLFVPKGMGNVGDSYLMGEKHNVCVVCGNDDPLTLTKHHVVPQCYRSHFPDEHKNHNPYDILPVCRSCHDVYEHEHADKLKADLGQQYDAPLDGDRRDADNEDERRASKFANALAQYGDRIPEVRKAEMLDAIEAHLGRAPTAPDIAELAERRVYPTTIGETHGQMVVARVGDLVEFIKLWRKHFVETMAPKHLPSNWDIDRPPKCNPVE